MRRGWRQDQGARGGGGRGSRRRWCLWLTRVRACGSLDEPCFRRYLWRAMWVREDYMGQPVVLPPAEQDKDELIDFSRALSTSHGLDGFENEEPM